MTLKPLEILKNGLSKFKKTIEVRKDELNRKLSQKETISSSDEHWLDNEANIIDEQRILETLESASDYEQGVEKLDDKGKAVIKKLRQWAGDLAKVAGKKWKCTVLFSSPENGTSLTSDE
jgi:predicted RNase H-like nuclease (RuvC/YqgF family)